VFFSWKTKETFLLSTNFSNRKQDPYLTYNNNNNNNNNNNEDNNGHI
jgi:hypothetical protein